MQETQNTFTPDPDSKTEEILADLIRCGRMSEYRAQVVRKYQRWVYAYEQAKREGRHEAASHILKHAMYIRPNFDDYTLTVLRDDVLRQIKKDYAS